MRVWVANRRSGGSSPATTSVPQLYPWTRPLTQCPGKYPPTIEAGLCQLQAWRNWWVAAERVPSLRFKSGVIKLRIKMS